MRHTCHINIGIMPTNRFTNRIFLLPFFVDSKISNFLYGGGVAIIIRKGIKHEIIANFGMTRVETTGVKINIHYSSLFSGR